MRPSLSSSSQQSLIARRSFEFKYDLKVPRGEDARSCVIRILGRRVIWVGCYHDVAVYITHDASVWGPFAHLRRLRNLLRLAKILCAIPGLY